MSCTSNEVPILEDEDKTLIEIGEIYESSQINTQKSLGQIYVALYGSKSRSNMSDLITGTELIRLLTSMPVETVDSLYNIYCTPQKEEEYDNCYKTSIDELIRLSSLDEVLQMLDFTDSYIENGGHNMTTLAEAIKNKTPIIQECMIRCAAGIDEFIGTSASRSSNAYCLHELQLEMAKSAVENEVIDVVGDAMVSMIGVPGVDAAGALVLAGYDLYSSLEMAHKYNMCCATHVS